MGVRERESKNPTPIHRVNVVSLYLCSFGNMKDEKTLVYFGKGPKRRMSLYPNVQAKKTRACDGQ